MNLAIESRRSQAAREAFEEPRRGEVLRTLSGHEIEAKAKELGAHINERERLDEDRKAYAKATGEKIKQLDHQVDALADEVEYGLAWVSAQAQFEDMWGDGGLVPEAKPAPASAAEAVVEHLETARSKKASKRKRKS